MTIEMEKPTPAAASEWAAEPAPRPEEESPFGTSLGGGRRSRRLITRALLVAAPVVALGAVYLATRGGEGGGPGQAAGAHAGHGAAQATDGARPVRLSGDETRRIGVTYAEVTLGPLSKEVRTVGQVTFDERRMATVSPKIDGWVERLYVNVTGQPVGRGDPLLAVYSPMLVSAQEELLLARRLAADVAGGTADARESAQELLASARRRLAYWDIPERVIARIERTGEVQRTLTLYSPAGGVVVEKAVLQGQRIMAGDALYRIADLSAIWVEGEVFEQDLPAVRLGQPVTATFDAYPGEQWRGTITYVYPTLAAETRTARVRVELPNPGLRLKPGMYATLRVTGVARGEVLSVPRSAVLQTGERSLVFVRRADGQLEPRTVTLGVATDQRVEILAGLRAGETVVASATFLVDAESNLGTALGGMGDMPGMEITTPPTGAPRGGAGASGAPSHTGHER